MRSGVAGLLRDKTRKSRIPPRPATRDVTIAFTQGDPPGEVTHWTAAMMAQAAGMTLTRASAIAPVMRSGASGLYRSRTG